MSSIEVLPGGSAEVTLAASDKIAVFTRGTCQILSRVGFPNYPTADSLVSEVSAEEYVSAAVSAESTYIIDNSGNPYPAFYEIGTAPVVKGDGRKLSPVQDAPNALNATGSITAAMILNGIVTSTTAAGVAGTIPTGAVLDAASEFDVGDSIDWAVINTGPNTFTVTAATGHTIVGVAAVATVTSALFRTKKTAADTFVTYRLAG